MIDKAWLEDGKLKLLFSDNSKDYAENQHVIPQDVYDVPQNADGSLEILDLWSTATAPVQRLIIFGETQIEQPR